MRAFRGASPFVAALAVAGLAFLVTIAGADETPVLCTGCGREIRGGAATCAACGVPAPAPATAADPPKAPPPAPITFRDSLRRDQALAARADKNAATARAAEGNAIALLALAPGSEVARSLLASHEARLVSLARETVACPVCHGTGRASRPKAEPLIIGGAHGTKTVEDSAARKVTAVREDRFTCRFCGGEGSVARVRDRRALLGLLNLGFRDYARAVEASGAVEWWPGSGLYVTPAEAAQPLDEAQKATIRLARPREIACRSCAGTGTVVCRTCDGIGRIPCPNRTFHTRHHRAKKSVSASAPHVEDHLLDAPSAEREPCPSCGAPAFDRSGSVPCATCGGRGLAVCNACEGTGERPRCRSCGGTGTETDGEGRVVPCNHCEGSGRGR